MSESAKHERETEKRLSSKTYAVEVTNGVEAASLLEALDKLSSTLLDFTPELMAEMMLAIFLKIGVRGGNPDGLTHMKPAGILKELALYSVLETKSTDTIVVFGGIERTSTRQYRISELGKRIVARYRS